MHFAIVCVLVAEVVFHVLGQEMASIAGGVNQYIGRGGSHRAIENRFQGLVARLAFFKTQVITKDNKFFWPCSHHINDVGQVDHVGFIYFNQAQPKR